MNIQGIYKILNIKTNKFYIGSAISFKRRQRDHFRELNNNSHCNNKLQNAYNKYGSDNFKFIQIEEVTDKTKLLEREQYYLDTLLFAQEYIKNNDQRFLELGYNLSPTSSSPLGIKRSEETKKKCSIANLGRTLSEETKNKMKGRVPPNKGIPLTEDQKQVIREANLGKILSEETKNKISISNTGKPSWCKGKTGVFKWSEEAKEKIRKPKTEQHKLNMIKAWKIRKQNKSSKNN